MITAKPTALTLVLAMFIAGSHAGFAQATPAFSDWKEQTFSLFSKNRWNAGKNSVSVVSRGTVSMLWTELPELIDAQSAAWTWSVDETVSPTRLDKKGGDDRNLSVYFIFMPRATAEEYRGASMRRLLGIEEARVLMYAWGGNHAKGAVLASPYLGARGRTIALRPASTGRFAEQVNLARDFRAAFGDQATTLVGLAVSSDSDDTDGQIRATLSRINIQ